MSLYDEGLELDRMYQNCRADVEALQERVQELEQLVSDYRTMHYGDLRALAQDIRRGGTNIDEFVEAWQKERDALQQRAKAALSEGKYESIRQEGES